MVLGGWEMWFTLALEGLELDASYWDSLIGACRELQSCNTPSILSRQEFCHQVNPFLFPQHFEKTPWLSWFWNFGVWSLCPPVPIVPILEWLHAHQMQLYLSVVMSWSIISMAALKSCHFFPSSVARAVCTLRSHSALLPCFVATPCLLPAWGSL